MDNFQQYLYRNYDSKGVYSFKLYVTKAAGGSCDFYIDPDNHDGEEAGFRVEVATVFSDPDLF